MIPLKLEFLETDLFGGVGRPPEGVTWNMTRQSDKKRKTMTGGHHVSQPCYTATQEVGDLNLQN